jgi:biopolymer transport protein ExbD
MTPMIDVVFLLLIFFVCTASFQPVEALLPSDLLISGAGVIDAPLEEKPRLERVVLRAKTDSDGAEWFVNEKPCGDAAGLRELLATLAQIDRRLPVVIDPDRQVALGHVIDGCDAARQAGFTEVKFAASLEQRE